MAAKVSTRRRTVDDAERLIKCMQTMPRNFNNNDMIEEVLGVFIIFWIVDRLKSVE